MANEPEIITQTEIEELMRQAQAAAQGAKQPAATGAATSALPVATATAPAPKPTSSAPAMKQPGDDINFLLAQAEQALASVEQPVAAKLEGLAPFQLRDFGGSPVSQEKATLELLRDVELDVKIELGRTYMSLEELLKLRKGAVVPLDKLAGDPVDIYINGRLVAHGEVLVLNDNFCVRVAELLASEEIKAA